MFWMAYVEEISSPSSPWKKNSQSQGARCWGRTHWTVSHHSIERAVKVHRCCFHQGFLLRCLWDSYTNSFSQINFFLRKNEIRKETSCNEHHTNKFWIAGREADKRNSNRFISSLPDPGLCLHYHVILRCTIHIPLMSAHFKGPETDPRALCLHIEVAQGLTGPVWLHPPAWPKSAIT